MLCTSGFMDDVTFGRNGPYSDTGAESDGYEWLVGSCCEILTRLFTEANVSLIYLL